ncbi:uncharacterized protein LOC142333588 isoform X5 [Lycorma delicatula]|uniref:uncharacterized protein LOC142333588 isoform X5 n=1 Tax=Lycorma delicatula TaxID=130591 RepID=UPI003F510E4B
MEETVSLFLPHHMSESGTTFEDEFDSSQLRKYPCDVNYDATETDPLAIDGTNFIKSENLKIKNELKIDGELLKDNTFDINYSNFPTELIKTEDIKIKNEKELDISLNVETLSQATDNVKTEEIDIDDEYLQKIKTEEVELPSNAS